MEKSFLTMDSSRFRNGNSFNSMQYEYRNNCARQQGETGPNKPVSLTVWHYYNGAQQAAFDQLVSEFNATEGKDKGIYVEGYTQGSVSDLEKAVSDAVSGAVGAQSLPDIFLYLRRYSLCSTERG